MRNERSCLASCGLLLVCWLMPVEARGDGGTVRLSQRAGAYHITVFTAPTPFRAGPVDVSVLVQDAATRQALPKAQVTVRVAPLARRDAAVPYTATTEAATNKLLQAALFELPEPGWWELEVVVQGSLGSGRARCEVEAAEPWPRWVAFWPWMSWPALVILLFGVHQFLVRSRSHPPHGLVGPVPAHTLGEGQS